jgi:hypothetical protein
MKVSRISIMLAFLIVSAVALEASAQLPVFIQTARDCTSRANQDLLASRPMLVGFNWTSPARADADPDILYDESWCAPYTGDGPYIGEADMQPALGGLYPNWRRPQQNTFTTDALVLSGRSIWLDSQQITIDGQDMGLVEPQSMGTMDGDAPEVVTLADRHAIRWHPLLEVDNTSCGPSGATPAGRGPRGFLVGYAVWSLPAATFAAPTPNDFLRFGAKFYAGLSTLDFGVSDVDGHGASDLDPSDGLILINPDGRPDTGDEIMELEVCPDGGLAHWYSVQPVVRGRFGYFDGGASSCCPPVPSALVDLTGDSVPDVADIGLDGYYEFSDGCEGLGLLYEDGIATSPHPGLGADLAAATSCPSPASCDRGARSGVSPWQVGGVYEPSALDLRNVTPLTVGRHPPSMLVVGWEETLGGTNAIYAGDLQMLFHAHRYTHVPVRPCGLTGSSSEIPLPATDTYFLVTQLKDGAESSYGRASYGVERPTTTDPCP